MPEFTGTTKQFKRYIGPHLRVLVQQLTKRHKKSVGACEGCGCGVGGELESAHVRGRDRNQIIEELLGNPKPESPVKVDLERFDAAFRAEHEPLEKSILVLCRSCHAKYDSNEIPNEPVREGRPEVEMPAERAGAAKILPITMDPSPDAEFKRQLLIQRRSTIFIHYRDGRVENRPWDASGFTENSNVIGNLRSRPEFRQGFWQTNQIVKVHVSVSKDA